MVRQIGKLAAVAVARTRKPGMYADGGGLYLQVNEAGARSWIFRFMLAGHARAMGLGSLDAVSLAEGRRKATDARQKVQSGIDPIEARKATQDAARLANAKAITFKECAERFIDAHKAGWRNAKHAAQWAATLEAYAYPVFGDLPVQAVDVALVTKVLEPIWTAKTETATRVRQRIEAVLDWASARGYRQGENPARWRGLLDKLLPKPTKVRRVVHHAALPYAEVGDFMAALRQQDGVAALALEYLILTAARTGEVTGARWSEIDMDKAAWTVPADRIKAGREHRVPLSAPAIAALRRMAEVRQDGFVFPGARKGRPLSNAAMSALMERMERGSVTVHGFRSSFRDWAAERTSYPREVAEAALAHALPDKTEAAYMRSDLFDKRRRLMAEWARFCDTPSKGTGAVVPMRRKVE